MPRAHLGPWQCLARATGREAPAVLALISSFWRAGNQWQQGIDHKFITGNAPPLPAHFSRGRGESVPPPAGIPSRARCDRPGAGVSPCRPRAGSSSVARPGAIGARPSRPVRPSCAGPRPARCAQPLEALLGPAAPATAQPGCSCRLTAELLFHASLVLLARN